MAPELATAAPRAKVAGAAAGSGCSSPAQFFLKKVTRLLERTVSFWASVVLTAMSAQSADLEPVVTASRGMQGKGSAGAQACAQGTRCSGVQGFGQQQGCAHRPRGR